MSELVSDTPSSPDWKLTISLNGLAPIFSVRARYQTSPGSRSPERVLMGTPAVGVKLMLVSTGLPSRTAARLAALRRLSSCQTSQFSHQELIGQPMKPVPPDPLRFVAAGDGQQPGHPRQVM